MPRIEGYGSVGTYSGKRPWPALVNTGTLFTYMLRCADGSYYVGHTDDVERRIAQHDAGAVAGYTATRLPIQLVWFEEFPTREEAKSAELQIKNWSRKKKEALIDGEIDELKQAARKDWASYRRRGK
jgi:tRNA/rRNA methyltransferase